MQPLDESYFEALLRAEHATTEHAASQWNHPGAQLACWGVADALTPAGKADTGRKPGAGALCLVIVCRF